ncbi:Myb-like DNA-binding domain containing protein [Histomonas meleagridis]|uniref:Myb-like DNA-binding domain containing protein n=1 Tax=Histomonas meleagridis TaxID=135588 RepID=UPI003559B0AE|nr:Myb-like DNA-binding domain containing protein [Histomonas meleagridis]KAH0802890.1 Myb-like DNA-binding domain containing protein [Histomonas meleagridis]
MEQEANLDFFNKLFTVVTGTTTDENKELAHSFFEILNQFFTSSITPEEANSRLEELTKTQEPLKKIYEMIKAQTNEGASDSTASSHKKGQKAMFPGFRKKSKAWAPEEDERLITGIQLHGYDNWSMVANYVGGGRTRAQCSQRWHRVLDPKIDKSNWSKEEEEKLIETVKTFGNKSWTRVSSEMGNRSDVQCRFRYRFLQKKAIENHTDLIPISAPMAVTQAQNTVQTDTDPILQENQQ